MEVKVLPDSKLLRSARLAAGLSYREVGEAMGMSPAAVRKAKSRVLRRLKEEFGDQLG